MPTDIGDDLIELTRAICDKTLRPQVDDVEARAATEEVFPREVFRTLGRAGMLSLPYPEELGGGGQPYEVYLQVVEEIASAWAAVAVGVSVHSLTAYAVHTYGTPEQQAALLPDMLSGETLGAYALSEPLAGSDIGAMTTRATPDGDDWRIRGRKAWISHAGHADYYTTFARTSDDGGRGVSCFVVPADAEGLSFGAPERKMGLHGDTVREVIFEDVPVAGDRQVGDEDVGGEWITPSNITQHKNKALGLVVEESEAIPEKPSGRRRRGKKKGSSGGSLSVACMTGDFAVQNVLLQMGLRLVSVDGARIERVKSWVLRCHACYKYVARAH